VIGLPPVLLGAVNVMTTCPLPLVAATPVGAPGTVAGVTEFDTVDGELVPAAFVAVMVNVYAVPLLKPVIVIGDDVLVALNPPIFELTV